MVTCTETHLWISQPNTDTAKTFRALPDRISSFYMSNLKHDYIKKFYWSTHIFKLVPHFFVSRGQRTDKFRGVCKQVVALQVQENYCHRSKMYVLTSLLKQIYLQTALCARLRCVIFVMSPSQIHVLWHPWIAMFLSWIGDDVTIVAIDSGWKKVTHTKQRRDMRLRSWFTLWLNSPICGLRYICW